MTAVSVIIASYNHEKFIKECLQSILDQTFRDFEIIITDDGSRDHTVSLIKQFDDPRIRLFQHAQNKGAGEAFNNGIVHSQGKYIAFIGSDDAWYPLKLEKQVQYLETHPQIAAVFSRVDWIDETGQPIADDENPYLNTFNAQERTRFEWLRLFFDQGNYLNMPSSVIRKSCFDAIGGFDPMLAGLHDFDLWIRICLRYDIHVLDEKLLRYRWTADLRNASSPTWGKEIRNRFEYKQILDNYLHIETPDDLRKIFPHAEIYGRVMSETIPYFLGRIAVESGLDFKILWGQEKLFHLLQDEKAAALVRETCNFTYADLIRMIREHDVFNQGLRQQLAEARQAEQDLRDQVRALNHEIGKIKQSSAWRTAQLIDRRYSSFASGNNPGFRLLKKLYQRFFLARQENAQNEQAAIQLAQIRGSSLFDANWYLEKNPDVASEGIDPALHYLLHGGFEGRDPGPQFNSRWYLETYTDVREAEVNPLVHYLNAGEQEGRSTGPVFKLVRMYEFTQEHHAVIFENAAEEVYLKRPQVISNIPINPQEGPADLPRPYVAFIKNATVFGGSALVVSGQHLLNDELVDFPGEEFGFKSPLLKSRVGDKVSLEITPDPQAQPIPEGILISCDHDFNYFHWLVECLPKLAFIDQLEQYQYVPLLIPEGLHQNLIAALERVNTRKRRIIYLKPNLAYQVQHLICPSPLSRVLDRYDGPADFSKDIVFSHKWIARVVELLKSTSPHQERVWRKLYLARRKGLRGFGNRDELEMMMVTSGYEVTLLEDVSLEFQIQLFSQTMMVAAPTGAALTNMLFCPPGTKVVIFMSDHVTTNYYFWTYLGDILQLDVWIILGERLFNLTTRWSVHDDYNAPIDLVVKRMISSQAPAMNYSQTIYIKTLLNAVLEWASGQGVIGQSQPGNIRDLRLRLTSIAEEIQQEIEKVKAKRHGGYWAVTKGDCEFIDYLGETAAFLQSTAADLDVSNQAMEILLNRTRRLLNVVNMLHHPPINVVFFAQEKSTWPSLESVHAAFTADALVRTNLVYIPFKHENKDATRDEFWEYKKNRLPIIHYTDYDLADEAPDMAFFVKPYDGTPQQFSIENVDHAVDRLIYIPYFVNWMAVENVDYLIDYHFRLPLQKKAWKIFDAPSFVRDIHARYGSRNGDNVENIGHPRYDIIRALPKIQCDIPAAWKSKISGRTVFMWNSHSMMKKLSENSLDWSTYSVIGQQMLDFFREQKELALLWRPHPMFFGSLLTNNLMSVDEVGRMKKSIEESENIILDELDDYRYAFSVADGLISDASSLLVEFLGTNKPILYLCKETTYRIVNENLLPAFYRATTWAEVLEFIDVIKSGRDDKRDARSKVIDDVLVNFGVDIGEMVKEICIRDLTDEETNCAVTIVARNPGFPLEIHG